MGLNFVAIDFETANSNYNSACSMGIVIVENNKIVDKFYTLIQPPTMEFDDVNIKIHGITPSDVATAPKFDEVWETIKHYFDGRNIITAYNAVFDVSVLKMCLKEYNIEYHDFEYVCALQLSKRLFPCENYKLDTVCNHLNIVFEDHHNSLADSYACAQIIINAIDELKSNSFEYLFYFLSKLSWKHFSDVKEVTTFRKSSKNKPKFNNSVAISDIKCSNDNINCNHIFYNKNFVFTGNLVTLERKEAMQKVVDVGGILKSSVSKSTNYLVVGIQDKTIIGSDGLSSKERRALELIESGQHIQILSEEEFLKLLA